MPPRQKLRDEIIRLYEENRRVPTQALMVGQGEFYPDEFKEEFGSWEAALQAAGLNPEDRDEERYDILVEIDESHRKMLRRLLESNEQKSFFRGQLLTEIHRLTIELGETPSISDMKAYGRYSQNSYTRYFGSWGAAVKATGQTPNKGTQGIPEEELLNKFRNVAERINGPPTHEDIKKHSPYSIPTYYSRFDTWEEICAKAGVTESR